MNLLNSHPKNVIVPMGKIPKGIPTPNPIGRDLSDVVLCAEDGVGVVDVIEKEVCCIVDCLGVGTSCVRVSRKIVSISSSS